MRSLLPLAPALAVLLLAPPLAAQAVPSPAAGAIRSAIGATPAGGAAAHHRILTLAWTEIAIPASLDRPAAPPHPLGHSRARIYTLAWQEAASAVRSDTRVASAPSLPCQTTVLVTLACE